MDDQKKQRTYKELLITFGPAVFLVVIGFWVASLYISPAPPKKITIATGSQTGAYFHFAKKYRQQLAKQGIDLQIIKTSGSKENISLLQQHQADVAFVQGGTGQNEENLLSLGSLYYEPIWIFVRKDIMLDKLTGLAGRKIAIGPNGSGTQMVATQLLQLNNVTNDTAKLLPLANQNAMSDLLKDNIDAAFFVASVNSPTVQNLLRNTEVYLMNLQRAETYARLLPFLSRVTLYEGSISLTQNFPDRKIHLLAPAANLVVRDDVHSALLILLLEAAAKTHSGHSLFSSSGDFPTSELPAFPVSEVAQRYYQVGPPFLLRYLPFWAAIFIDRTIVMLIPLLALLFPMIKVMPPIYRWRVRSKIYRWYKELQDVDNKSFNQNLSVKKYNELNQELDRIEEEVNKVKTPLSYADQLYNLLLHIDLIRKKLKLAEQ